MEKITGKEMVRNNPMKEIVRNKSMKEIVRKKSMKKMEEMSKEDGRHE